MPGNLPTGCTDSHIDEDAPGYDDDKHEKIYPKGVYWAPNDQEKECDQCGKTWPESEMAWAEPNNMGFSGWDGGMWLCPDCLMDWKDGSINL